MYIDLHILRTTIRATESASFLDMISNVHSSDSLCMRMYEWVEGSQCFAVDSAMDFELCSNLVW